MRDTCKCQQQVARLNEDWETTEVWLYNFDKDSAAVLQVRDGAN